MPSELSRRRLLDIRHNIYLVIEWVAGFTVDQFAEDTMRVYAVVRALEIISEASRGLDADVKARHPDLPWPSMAGAGNVYRHDYDQVRERIIWRTATIEIPILLAAVESELAR
jgi:uncharacterized protein with HEPN domain